MPFPRTIKSHRQTMRQVAVIQTVLPDLVQTTNLMMGVGVVPRAICVCWESVTNKLARSY